MSGVDYRLFLENKLRRNPPVGITVEPGELHPSLFPFQQYITAWALRTGRCAVFADTGLGKTRIQLEWARHAGKTTLILAPLSVARQTSREAAHLDLEPTYVRSGEQVTGPGIYITNYEMADRFDPAAFDAVILDESSILKNHSGATRTQLIRQWKDTAHRLACTATPAPNDVTELCNHAEYLGVMPRNEMLAAYFIHDDEGWRLKGHAARPMYNWMATWALAARRPSDLGYADTGYDLPPLNIHAALVNVDLSADGQLFPTELGGIGGRAAVRRSTLDDRCDKTVDLASRPGQWIVWCGLNAESDRIAADTPDAVNVKGNDTPEQKAAALEAFQDGEIRVLVTKPSIAGAGMNFQNCHQQVFCGLSDSWESYYQAIRRSWRFGQTRPVDIHIVVSELEQQIVDNVRRKEAEAQQAVAMLVEAMNRQEISA